MTLDGINMLDRATFVTALGGTFEHSPWIAERTWPQWPFTSVGALHTAMCSVVDAATTREQMALIRAHPALAGKAALRGELTEASAREQRGAELDQCSPAELKRLTELNVAYRQKFGFPFIIAVRGLTRAAIIEAMAQRLLNDPQTEHDEALRQIARIAGLRLRDMIEPEG